MGDHDLGIIVGLIFLLSGISGFSFLLPTAFQFITVLSLAVFGVSSIAVAGVCLLSTGIPCAIMLGISGLLTFMPLVGYIVPSLAFLTTTSSFPWITTFLITPLQIIFQVFIAKLARGQ